MEISEYELELLNEVKAECVSDDRVAQRITYHSFVSKSKGRRNGKKRLRKNWKEVRLVKYNDGFHYWHRFPFDVYATEIIGDWADSEALKERVESLSK